MAGAYSGSTSEAAPTPDSIQTARAQALTHAESTHQPFLPRGTAPSQGSEGGAVIGCETRRSLGPEAASEPDRQGHCWCSHSS